MNRNNDAFLSIGWGLFKITYGYEQICKRGNHNITTEFQKLVWNSVTNRNPWLAKMPLCQISMKLELVERYRLVYSEKTYFLSEFYRFVLEK